MNQTGGEVDVVSVGVVVFALYFVLLISLVIVVLRIVRRLRHGAAMLRKQKPGSQSLQRSQVLAVSPIESSPTVYKSRLTKKDSTTRQEYLYHINKMYPSSLDTAQEVKLGRPISDVVLDVGYRYTRRRFIMTKAERDFYKILQQALNSAYVIYPQAHLDMFLEHKFVGQDWRAALAKIQRKSVDFLVCNREYYSPLVAIELDDSSHRRQERIERDEIVDKICADADMPLVRIPWAHSYDSNDLLYKLAPYLK